MPNEIKGLENSMPIRMVYIDTMEEVILSQQLLLVVRLKYLHKRLENPLALLLVRSLLWITER